MPIIGLCIYTYIEPRSKVKQYTVNGERFAGLNFHGFRGCQEYHESFSINISATLKY